jgi:hypothetical protein
MSTPLEEAMARATNEDLYEILHLNREEYSAEAIAVAEHEFSKRNLEPAQLEELLAGSERKRLRAAKPLSLPVKVVLFLCGFSCVGILGLPILATVVEVSYRGADNRYRESWRWIGYGIMTFMVLLALCFMLIVIGRLSGRTA